MAKMPLAKAKVTPAPPVTLTTPSAPRFKISDPFDDLKKVFTGRSESLEKTVKEAIDRSNQVIIFVIIVMVIGFIILLFSLATVLITSWQATQSIHDAVQVQTTSSKASTQSAPASKATNNTVKFSIF